MDLPQVTPSGQAHGLPGYAISKVPITHIAFAPDSEHMTVADAEHVVALFRRELPPAAFAGSAEHRDVEWVFIGRCRAHYGPIVGLMFIPPDPGRSTGVRLISVSQDRHVAEYDVEGSTVGGGVVLKVSIIFLKVQHQKMTLSWCSQCTSPNRASDRCVQRSYQNHRQHRASSSS